MSSSKYLTPSALATLVLAGLASTANAQVQYIPYSGPVEQVTVDYATGQITRHGFGQHGVPGTIAQSQVCYSNSSTTSGFVSPFPGEEWVDWGQKLCGTTGKVDRVIFGYTTDVVDQGSGGPGVALTIAIYQGTTGQGTLGAEVARYSLTDLPGTSGAGFASFVVTLDLSGDPSVTVPPDNDTINLADGPVGWGYKNDGAGQTGPSLVFTTGNCTLGTFDLATATQDCFDRYLAPANPGSYLTTTATVVPGTASFYMEFGEDDGTSPASVVVNEGTGFNPNIFFQTSPAAIGSNWETDFDMSFVPSFGGTFVLMSTSATTGILPFPGATGELLVDIFTPPFFALPASLSPGGTTHALPIPNQTQLIGLTLRAQGGVILTPLPSFSQILLTNGLTFTIGT